MSVRAYDNGITDVEVNLSVGNRSGADVYLIGSDRLMAEADGQSQLMAEEQDWPNTVRHLAAFDVNDPGTQITISFERSDYTPAPDSHVDLPETITFNSPEENATLAPHDDLTVSWEPSGVSDAIHIRIDTTCSFNEGSQSVQANYTVADSGSETYSVDDLLGEWEREAGETCTTNIKLERENKGAVAAEFRGGTIVALRDASVSIKIAP